jgi:ribosome-binding protein aMBF1 (putative translation factor)
MYDTLNDAKQSLADEVRNARIERGLSQEKLAENSF